MSSLTISDIAMILGLGVILNGADSIHCLALSFGERAMSRRLSWRKKEFRSENTFLDVENLCTPPWLWYTFMYIVFPKPRTTLKPWSFTILLCRRANRIIVTHEGKNLGIFMRWKVAAGGSPSQLWPNKWTSHPRATRLKARELANDSAPPPNLLKFSIASAIFFNAWVLRREEGSCP